MKTRIATAILTLTAMSAVTPIASANNMVANGSFDPDKKGWQPAGVDEWGGHQDGAFNLNGDGKTNPQLTQPITGLVSGQEYLLTAKYKAATVGGATTDKAFQDANRKRFLEIKVGGVKKDFYQVHENRNWHLLYFKFKPENGEPLVLTGELDGHDINVLIDDVHLAPVSKERVHVRAFPIDGAAGDNTDYFVSAESFNSQGLAQEGSSGAADLIIHSLGDDQVILALEDEDGKNLRFLSATDELDESGSHKVSYLPPVNENDDIPSSAIFIRKDALFNEPLPENAKNTLTNGFFSLESAEYPGRYLRHFQFKLVVNNNTPEERRGPLDLYHRDATWTWTTAGGTIDTPPTPPANAMKLDVEGGAFTFGYSTKAKPGFNKFDNIDTPYIQDTKVKRRNTTGNDPWFSFTQNTGDAASDPKKTQDVFYPAKDEGSGVLHPGNNLGDVTKARFTAPNDAEYNFEITATLIATGPTGAGVTIYVDEKVVDDSYKTYLDKDQVPWTRSFKHTLKAGETVDIAVDNGNNHYARDHVLVTAKAWPTSN